MDVNQCRIAFTTYIFCLCTRVGRSSALMCCSVHRVSELNALS